MTTIFEWEVLAKNSFGGQSYPTLERLAVDGGYLYRTTERQSKYSDYYTILAQQVTFVPMPREPEAITLSDEALLAAEEDRVDKIEIVEYLKANKWTRDSDDDIRDAHGTRMIWYKTTKDADGNISNGWKAKGIDFLFSTEDAAILTHKGKFGA